MLSHVAHAVRNGHQKIIQTVDTDVVVLAVAATQGLKAGDELWLAFSTGKSFRYLAAHKISAALGLRKHVLFQHFMLWLAVTQYQALLGMGKKAAWAVFPELTNALLELSSAPHDILQEVMATIERCIILLYDRTSTSTDIDQARRKLFAKRHNVQSIPPTNAALKEHVKRAVYQGGHVWGQMLVSTPALLSPCKWGWSKASEGHYEPFWTYLMQASPAMNASPNVRSKCKKGCVKQCKCKTACLRLHSRLCEGDC